MTSQEEYLIETASRFCRGYYGWAKIRAFLEKATPEQLEYVAENLQNSKVITKLLNLVKIYITKAFEKEIRPFRTSKKKFVRERFRSKSKNNILSDYPLPELTPVENFLTAADKKNIKAGSLAKDILGRLKNLEAQVMIVNFFIENNDALAGEISREAGYAPVEIENQVLYFVLSRQWDKLEAIDPNYTRLVTVFKGVPKHIESRMYAAFREGGRSDIANQLLFLDQYNSDKDTTVFGFREKIEQLKNLQQWDELWRLVFETSPDWSKIILSELVQTNWIPANQEHKVLYQRLCELAGKATPSISVNHLIEYLDCKILEPYNLTSNGNFILNTEQVNILDIYSAKDNSLLASFQAIEIIEEDIIYSLIEANNLRYDEANDYFELEIDRVDFSERENVIGISGKWKFFKESKHFFIIFRRTGTTEFTKSYIRLSHWCNNIIISPNGNYALLHTSGYAVANLEIYDLAAKKLINVLNYVGLKFGIDESTVILKTKKFIKFFTFPDLLPIKQFPIWDYTDDFKLSLDGKVLVAATPTPQAWDLENDVYLSDFQIRVSNERAYPYGTQIHTEYGNYVNPLIMSHNSEFLVIRTIKPSRRSEELFNLLVLITKSGQVLPIYKSSKHIRVFYFTNNSKSIIFQENNTTLKTYSILAHYLYNLPVKKSEYQDFLKLQKMIGNPKLTTKKRNWLKFIEACHALKWHYEIQVDNAPTLTPDEFDIEVETENQN